MEKQMLPSIENFIDAVINTNYLDRQEMYDLVWHMAETEVNRLRVLRSDRNR